MDLAVKHQPPQLFFNLNPLPPPCRYNRLFSLIHAAMNARNLPKIKSLTIDLETITSNGVLGIILAFIGGIIIGAAIPCGLFYLIYRHENQRSYLKTNDGAIRSLL